METKYLTIYHEIVQKIEERSYATNDKLPSEHELMQQYTVSRDTIRKALTMLEQNGYIQKTQGKGSFVLDVHQFNFPVSGIVSFKEISHNLGRHCTTQVEKLVSYKAKKELSSQLELGEDKGVWELIRTRSIDGEKVILDKDFIVKRLVSELSKEVCADSLYNYVENELGLKIAYAKKEITAQMVTTEDKKYLDMKQFDMVIVVRSYTYLEDTSLFQYTESRHRPDKFVFVDFARR